MVEKSSVVLENTYIIMNEILVELLMLKVILIRAHKKMKNMLLETAGGKEILIM